jgi:transcriptional regulator with XRE-family HTH domain
MSDEIRGTSLRIIRAQRLMSRDDLAAESGISASWIKQIELGKARPSLECLYKLADGLRCRVGDFTVENPTVEPLAAAR